jgi:hypothetical protein
MSLLRSLKHNADVAQLVEHAIGNGEVSGSIPDVGSMENKIDSLEQEVREIKERNLRVESDKAWETSLFRTLFISALTYIVASIVLYFLGSNSPLLNAFVPTVGYFLSTQSLPFIKKWWIRHRSYMPKYTPK